MRISMQTVYAFRFIIHLAKSDIGDFIQLKDIARLEGIPVKYLEKIVQIVKRADLISVKRGSKGGYRLKRKIKTISVKDFFYLLERKDKLVDDNVETKLSLWAELESLIATYLNSLTFSDLLVDSDKQKMYYI